MICPAFSGSFSSRAVNQPGPSKLENQTTLVEVEYALSHEHAGFDAGVRNAIIRHAK